jgi:hypothetical protein
MSRSSAALRIAAAPPTPTSLQPTVDEWGRDARLIGALAPLASLRWDVSVSGRQLIGSGAALIVVNARRFALSPIVAALALSDELARPVRFVGRPDYVPFGPFLRRLGGLLAQPGEVAGALRAGELVIATASPELIGAAIREHAPVHVAAITSALTSRSVHIEISEALAEDRGRHGPLAEVEFADVARLRLQQLLGASA